MTKYEEIIENLQPNKIIKLMTNLGADRYEEHDTFLIFPTICHNLDSNEASMKLYYYFDTHLFYCYTECGAQNPFKFLEHYYKTRNIDYNWYTDIYSVLESCASIQRFDGFEPVKPINLRKEYERKQQIKELTEYPKGILDIFQKYYPIEWLKDGITQRAMDKYNILYSTSQNKIIIPHYDVHGRLIGIRGRALNEWEVENIGKYMPVQIEDKWYSHPLSLNLYGLNENLENIKQKGIVFLCEGEKGVLQAESFGDSNCAVAVCGSSFNRFQLKILLKHCYPNEIVICFDKEEKPGEDKYFFKLWNMCKKYSNYCNFSFVYDRDNLLKLKDSPTDRGKEVFEKLIERRIRVK